MCKQTSVYPSMEIVRAYKIVALLEIIQFRKLFAGDGQ